MPVSACPSKENAHRFDGARNPHPPSWNATATGEVPIAMRDAPGGTPDVWCCDDSWEVARQDMGFRNRSASVVDLDDMLGTIFDGLGRLGLMDTTFVIFSSDNGYHLGEHHLLFGKCHPYEHDIRLPMYIRGPGVREGVTAPHPTTHLDIVATIVDFTGATPALPGSPPIDGKSFRAVLGQDPPAVSAWRSFSFSEFYDQVLPNGNCTWHAVRHIDDATGEADWTYHRWCSGQAEVFDKTTDHYEMHNVAAGPMGKAIDKKWLPITVALGKCVGAACNAAAPAAFVPAVPLRCSDPPVADA